MIYIKPFPLLYGKGWNKKVTIGKSSQKEHLVFHGQLNWCISHTFHNKNGFHIHWVDYLFLWYIQLCTQEPFLFH